MTELEQRIFEFENEKSVVKKAKRKVKKTDRLSVILFGPEKSGKSTIAYFLSEEHQRGIVNLSDLLSWCEKNSTPTYAEAAKYLLEKDEEFKIAEEQDKKKKGKKKEGEEDFDPRIYKYLPKEMLIKLIIERTNDEDCNAGIIFDNLHSENWKDEKTIIDTICDALAQENVHLVTIGLSKDEDGLEYCENYRYKMRKMVVENITEKEVLDKTFVDKEATVKKGGAKRAKKKELTEDEKGDLEAKKRLADEEEKAKLLKEEETKKRLDEPEPKNLTDEEKIAYNDKLQEILELFTEINLRQMNQRHEAEIEENQEDQVEEKKEENKDIKDIEEVEKKQEGEGEGHDGEGDKEQKESNHFGTRILYEVPIQYNFRYLCEKVKEQIPEPIWPDPDKEPLPAPSIEQIIKKPGNRPIKPPVTLFSIWTPVDKLENEPEEEEEKEIDPKDAKAKGKAKDAKDAKDKGKAKEKPKEPEVEAETIKGPLLDNRITRWILQPGEVKPLHIKFFSTKVGKFNQTLNFEVVGATKQFPLEIKALCEFPTINSNSKNVFMLQKRLRPSSPPESYLQKCFVVNENVFDFGPLLIGKDAEKRNDGSDLSAMLLSSNSSQFRISNNGKYDMQVTFALESTLTSDKPQGKTPFFFEPESMTLKVEETQNLTVWCFPDENKEYNDKIVALIKNNPNPVVFNVKCTGAKPIIKVDNAVVQFDRLLLNKPAKRTMKLTNNCQIPIKWNLTSDTEAPTQFVISKMEGVLKP